MSTDTTRGDNSLVRSAGRSITGLLEGYWLKIWTAIFIVFLYIPIVFIVVFSFEKGEFSTLPWSGFTLHWYRVLLDTSVAIDAIYNSLLVAVVVTTLATVMGTLGAIALVRHDFRLKRVYRSLVIAPMTIPGLILGIALLMLFNVFSIDLSLYTIMLGQLVFIVPFVLITVTARLRGFDRVLEEAARDLGATRWSTYRHVTLPILAPGIISGALFAFTLSFDDFLIAFFTGGPNNTLPVYIYSNVIRTTTPVVNAISAVALFVSMILIILSQYLQR